jgi:NAD(P)H-dependent flavin oxidoreductase YrpB (nitropropane dioxygenase family)
LSQRGALDLARQAVTLGGLNLSDDPGDVQNAFLPLGQVAGRIDDIPTAKEVVERTVAEAEEVIKALQKKVG